MTSGQSRFPLAPSIFKFKQYGKSGTWVSELLPWTAQIVDDIALIKTVWTEAINHEPAITYIQTGNMNTGQPSLGSWISYGLGSMNENLPTFIVLTSKFRNKKNIQALSSRLWSQRLSPFETCGRAPARLGRSGAVSVRSRRGRPRRSAGRCSTASTQMNQIEQERSRRSRNRDAHHPI